MWWDVLNILIIFFLKLNQLVLDFSGKMVRAKKSIELNEILLKDDDMGFRDYALSILPCLKNKFDYSFQTLSILESVSSKQTILLILIFWKPAKQNSCKSICSSMQLLKAVVTWRVGNGRSIDMSNDNWIPREQEFKPFTPNFLHVTNPTVFSSYWKRRGLGFGTGSLYFLGSWRALYSSNTCSYVWFGW